jgi:hypothetical protein
MSRAVWVRHKLLYVQGARFHFSIRRGHASCIADLRTYDRIAGRCMVRELTSG